ncbi:cytochrome b5-like [Magnolia sinica]|uniref:cytochrome b5-like n=1 Tax=Magnolia sinica TaxID=86752 RepID=UPI002659A4EB|nr:cytochrome b5-like [Magnolia sinica]
MVLEIQISLSLLFGVSVSMEERKLFSLSEVSLHTSKNDCWLIIGGKVYNVTEFLEEHPGGDDVLIQASANGDATEAFEEVGHSSTATAMMSGYLIGVLEGSDYRDDVGGPHQEQPEGGFVTAKTVQEKRPPSASAGLLDFLVPLLIVAIALGAWYFYNRSQI